MNSSLNNDVLKGKVVLVVEDDVIVRRGIKKLLEKLGCVVHVAKIVEKAYKFLDEYKFDLIILDSMLPKTESDQQKLAELAKKLTNLDAESKEADLDNNINKINKLRKDRERLEVDVDDLTCLDAGREIAMHIREKRKEKVPILFITAIGDEETIALTMHLIDSNVEWLVKPVETNVIRNMCMNLIDSPEVSHDDS